MLGLLVVLLLSSVFPACGTGAGRSESPQPSPVPAGAISLTVRPDVQFQTFEAWRATPNGPYYLNASGSSQLIPSGVLNQLLDDLAFDLGLNGFRILIHEEQMIEAVNDNSDPFSIDPAGFHFDQPYQLRPDGPLIDPVAQMQQTTLSLKSRVESRGEPFSIYVNPDFGASPAHWHLPEEYAEFAEAYILWARSRFGLTPNYWVVLNEPSSTFIGAELQNDIIAVGSRFRARGFATKLQTTETVRPDVTSMFAVVGNPQVAQHVGLLSFHGYDYPSSGVPSFTGRNSIRTLAREMGLRTGMTETCCKSGWNGGYNQALDWARDIYWNLTEADISVWEPFGIMARCATAGCSSVGNSIAIGIDVDLSRYFKLPAYYGLRQYSHFIRPGHRRIGVDCPGCTSSGAIGQKIKPVAFQTQAGNILVVIINDQEAAQDISINGLPVGTYDITGVDPTATSGQTFQSSTISGGQPLVFRMPAQAIVTFARR